MVSVRPNPPPIQLNCSNCGYLLEVEFEGCPGCDTFLRQLLRDWNEIYYGSLPSESREIPTLDYSSPEAAAHSGSKVLRNSELWSADRAGRVLSRRRFDLPFPDHMGGDETD